MLALSKVFSSEETFPVAPSSPIHGVVAAFKQMHIGPTLPTASPLLAPYPLDFSNPIPLGPHDSHNAIDIFPSHHHSLPDALTSLNAGPVEGLPARVAPSATAAANEIILYLPLQPLEHLSLWTTTPSPGLDLTTTSMRSS